MKLIDIIKRSESFSCCVCGADLAAHIAGEFRKLGFEYAEADMERIFADHICGRASKYRFELWPKAQTMAVYPVFGHIPTDTSSLENPVFSQEIVIFILWLLRNEGSA